MEYLFHAQFLPGFSFLDEALILILLGLLAVKGLHRLKIPVHFATWIPFLFLFTISLLLNLSQPVLAVNLLLSYLKPFILAVAVVNFLDKSDIRLVLKGFCAWTLLQIPFLAWQLGKIGYVTGTAADDYVGCLNSAHLVGGLAIVPGLWLLGKSLWEYKTEGSVNRGQLLSGMGFYFIPIFCEAKHVYMGVFPGMILFALFMDPRNFMKMASRMAILIIPMSALVFYFGFQYFQTMNYQTAFEFFQKIDAYFVTFFELPDKIPFPFIGAGPGMYGSAIALKTMPPLADHFFGEQIRTLEVGGTFMTPFSELNGAIGELGYLGPVALLLPYVLHLALCLRAASKIRNGLHWGAMFCAGSILTMLIPYTIIAQSFVLHHLTFPALFLSTMVLFYDELGPERPESGLGSESPIEIHV